MVLVSAILCGIPWKLRPFNIIIITNTRHFVYFKPKPKRVQYCSILHTSTIQLKSHVYVIIYFKFISCNILYEKEKKSEVFISQFEFVSFFCRFCDVTKDQVFNTTCHHIFKWAPQVWRQWNHHLMVSISRRAMSTKLAYSCRCLWLLSFAWWISFQGSCRPPLYGAAVHTPRNLTPPSTTPWGRGSSPVAWNPLQPSSCQYYLALYQRPYVGNTTHTDLCPRHCKTHTTSYTITSRALPILDVNAHPIVSIFQMYMYSTDEEESFR